MEPKDYYFVLGVSRTESADGIRRAFRDLVRQHHPDRAGPGGAPAFRKVVEAYRVLADPAQRRAHDQALWERERSDRGPSPREPNRGPFRAKPVRRDGVREGASRSVAPRRRPGHSSTASLFGLLARDAWPLRSEASARREPLLCDIVLSAQEARRGGVLPIRLPVFGPCVVCRGAGQSARFPCRPCGATGRVRSEVAIPIEVPAGTPPGTVFEIPLDAWGIRNFSLKARIGVRG